MKHKKKKEINDEKWKIIKNLEKYIIKYQLSFKQNNKNNCTLCIGDKHSMRAKYTSSCNCFDPFCSVKYKALICCKNEFKMIKKTTSNLLQKR